MSECKYCGHPFSAGYSCYFSPDGIHEMVPDNPKVCVRCGSTNYGSGCIYPHPDNNGRIMHKHGQDGLHCVWCGTKLGVVDGAPFGSSCAFSPTGRHSLT